MKSENAQTGKNVTEENFFMPHLSGFQLFKEKHSPGEAPLAEWYSKESPDARIGLWEAVEELASLPAYSMLHSARNTTLSHHSWYGPFYYLPLKARPLTALPWWEGGAEEPHSRGRKAHFPSEDGVDWGAEGDKRSFFDSGAITEQCQYVHFTLFLTHLIFC